jgi:tetratricopeptide (TPR) repeat protein
MILHVTGGKVLPKEIADQIVDRTDGVPLFIEELTKTVVESGIITEAGDHYAINAPGAPLAIPTTLHGSLLARLDRLAPTRELAQIGAALGRQFSYELIRAVAEMPQQRLDESLTQLVRAELVFQRGTPPDAEYAFKHALVQDAAYSTLLRSRRQQLHGRIAATMEREFPEIVEMQPELLARHCAEAGLIEKAVMFWCKAGQQAIGRGAMTEAVAQLRKSLDLISGLPDGTDRQERELIVQITFGQALMAAKGLAAPEVNETFARARYLCDQLHRPPRLDVLTGQISYDTVRGNLERAEYHAQEMRQLGETHGDVTWRCFGFLLGGVASFYLGKFIEARVHHENTLLLWDAKFRAFWANPDDPYVLALLHYSYTLLCLGYVDHARLRRDEMLVEARRISPYNQVLAQTLSLQADWAMEGARAAPTMLLSAEEVSAICAEQGYPLWGAIASIIRGWCLGTIGRAGDGLPLLIRGLADYAATGVDLVRPLYLMMLAEVYGLAAQPEEGLAQIAEAAKTTQERWAEAEMHRIRGKLLMSMNEHSAAEESYHQALGIARSQSAKFWELRAAMSMARLWRDQGRRQQARELLAPVYGWFTEGFDTLDLKEAKALLEQLKA